MMYRVNTDCDFEGEIQHKPPSNKIGRFEDWLCRKFQRFDIISGGELYLRRWLIDDVRDAGKVYLHKIYRSDADTHLHDHPWDAGVCLFGPIGYREELYPNNDPVKEPDWDASYKAHMLVWKLKETYFKTRQPFSCRHLLGPTWHKVHLHVNPFTGAEIPCWTLCVVSRKYRPWGFMTKYGKVDHDTYFRHPELYHGENA